jgi:hypothetical protein|eukprot:g3786.t1
MAITKILKRASPSTVEAMPPPASANTPNKRQKTSTENHAQLSKRTPESNSGRDRTAEFVHQAVKLRVAVIYRALRNNGNTSGGEQYKKALASGLPAINPQWRQHFSVQGGEKRFDLALRILAEGYVAAILASDLKREGQVLLIRTLDTFFAKSVELAGTGCDTMHDVSKLASDITSCLIVLGLGRLCSQKNEEERAAFKKLQELVKKVGECEELAEEDRQKIDTANALLILIFLDDRLEQKLSNKCLQSMKDMMLQILDCRALNQLKSKESKTILVKSTTVC